MKCTVLMIQFGVVRCRFDMQLLGPALSDEDNNRIRNACDIVSPMCCTTGYYDIEVQDESGRELDAEIAVA